MTTITTGAMERSKVTSFVIGALLGAGIVQFKDKIMKFGLNVYSFCKEKMQKSTEEKVTEEVSANNEG